MCSYAQVAAAFEPAVLEEKSDGTQTISSANLGACIPLSTWSAAAAEVQLLWHVRWVPGGLMPVRPALTLCADVIIPPKHAFKTWVG